MISMYSFRFSETLKPSRLRYIILLRNQQGTFLNETYLNLQILSSLLAPSYA